MTYLKHTDVAEIVRRHDARSRLAESTGPKVRDPHTVGQPSRNPSATLAVILAAVLEAISGGARSATSGDTSALSYADGWTSAATLARLVAADAMADLISPAE